MPFSTFPWRTEDNYLNSMNYMHIADSDLEENQNQSKSSNDDAMDTRDDGNPNQGCAKIWYGVSSAKNGLFESCLKRLMPERFSSNPDLIYRLTTMVSPPWLMEQGVQVSRLVQRPGEFVITFPGAYHSEFSLAWNVSESVNFATLDWIKHGRACKDRYIRDARDPIVAHDKLVWSLAMLETKNIKNKADLQLIQDEIKKIRTEEFVTREKAQLSGIKFASRMPEEDVYSDEADCQRQCLKCKAPCSFSAIVCSCSPGKVTCLHHIKDLCACNNSVKCLVYWKSIGELDELLSKIDEQMKTLN